MRAKLSQSYLSSLEPPTGHTASGKPVLSVLVHDTEVRGLAVQVRRSGGASFLVLREKGGRVFKCTIGSCSTWTVEKARARARELLVQLDKGEDPRGSECEKYTLGQALEAHLADMKRGGCSQRGQDTLGDEVTKYLGDWLQRPLQSLTPADARKRYEKLLKSGPYLARRVLVHLRTLWNSAGRQFDQLGRWPGRALRFAPTPPSRKVVQDLAAWWSVVRGLPPVRRDLLLFLLCTGLRSTDGCTVRWEDVDFEDGYLTRPCPKGGTSRAFSVPLAKPVLDLLRRQPQVGPWVWPAETKSGHVEEPKVQGYRDGKKVQLLPGPHTLRRTMISAAYAAGVPEVAVSLLANHQVPTGSTTRLYLGTTSTEWLRPHAETVCRVLLTQAQVSETFETRPPVPGRVG
jgi:integrase